MTASANRFCGRHRLLLALLLLAGSLVSIPVALAEPTANPLAAEPDELQQWLSEAAMSQRETVVGAVQAPYEPVQHEMDVQAASQRGAIDAAYRAYSRAARGGSPAITYRGPVGCAELPPGPPANLKAMPGDGSVTLAWDKPANGACVEAYQVTVVPLGRGARALSLPPQRTPDYNLTIFQLENSKPYRFLVVAFSSKYNGGGEASVEATPQAPAILCSRLLAPSGPTDLKATPGAGSVRLCWGPPGNQGCVDEFRVAATVVSTGRSMGAAPLFWSYNTGGCVDVDGLVAGSLYKFEVQSWAKAWASGGSATIRARPL